MITQLDIFATAHDDYQQAALDLRSHLLATEGAEPLTPLLVSMLARAHGMPYERAQRVVEDIGDDMGWTIEQRRRFSPVVAETMRRFSSYIDEFRDLYVRAATQARPGGREAWQAYMNELIDLFEDGEVRASH